MQVVHPLDPWLDTAFVCVNSSKMAYSPTHDARARKLRVSFAEGGKQNTPEKKPRSVGENLPNSAYMSFEGQTSCPTLSKYHQDSLMSYSLLWFVKINTELLRGVFTTQRFDTPV